jgi:type 1 glutamine amidotransferase
MKLLRLPLVLLTLLAVASAVSAADTRKKIVMLIAEPEYDTAKTLPEFAAKHLKDFRVVVVSGTGENSFDQINEIASADVLLVSVRRRYPPPAELDVVRRHVKAGKPVVGIRTASHSFAVRPNQKVPDGMAAWQEFDAEVIGGNYSNHYPKGAPIKVTASGDTKHPILAGVSLPFESESSLYKNTPLKPGTHALLTGTIPNQAPEPLAWTYSRPGGGKTFYTSLGSPTDFQNPAFVTLLRNGIVWAAGQK